MSRDHNTGGNNQEPGADVNEVTSIAMVGSAATVLDGFRRFIALTAPDELMVVSHIDDHAARVRSFEIVVEAAPALA